MRSAQILWEALMTLTRKQQRLRTEIEDISSIIWMDHWHIEKYPPKGRTDLLIVMKDKLVRGEVITKYAVIDELLTMIICNYYFHKSKRELTYRRLWKTRRFAIFNHYIMDEVYLLKKMSIVASMRTIPKEVTKIIARINDLRNALAHSMFPQNRRQHMPHRKVMYQGLDIFTKPGVEKFEEEFQIVRKYLDGRARTE
jgi:hypothetical protein